MDESPKEQRKSFFDLVKSKVTPEKLALSSYLVVVVGLIDPTMDRLEISAHYQKLLKSLQNENEKITGMLLLYKTSFVHLLQGPKRAVYNFLRDMRPNSQNNHKIKSSQCRILVLLDDVKDKIYPFWASKIIDAKDDQAKIDFTMMDAKAIDDLITSTCVQLFKIGDELGKMNKNDMKVAFEDITEQFRGMLPTRQYAEDLGSFNEILSVEQWLKEFDENMDVILESELVWPVSKPLLI